jgi:hypothetical protein
MKMFNLVFLLCTISQFCPAKTLPVDEKNRIDTFKAMDTFLGKCLPTTSPQ